MKPTLLVGDFLFVNKMAYGYSWASCPNLGSFNLCWFARDLDGRILGDEPEPGDIIVFKHPVDGRDFIKRLIGVPGDKVRMSDGRLIINDVELEPGAEWRFQGTEGAAGSGRQPAPVQGSLGCRRLRLRKGSL